MRQHDFKQHINKTNMTTNNNMTMLIHNFEFLQNIVTTFLKISFEKSFQIMLDRFCYGVVLLPGSTKKFKILFFENCK